MNALSVRLLRVGPAVAARAREPVSTPQSSAVVAGSDPPRRPGMRRGGRARPTPTPLASVPSLGSVDGQVVEADLGVLAQHYGSSGPGIGFDEGDLNGDGVVDVKDLGILAQQYGRTLAAP